MFKPDPYCAEGAFLRFFVGLMPEVGKTFAPDRGPDRDGVEEKSVREVSAVRVRTACGAIRVVAEMLFFVLKTNR
jgi:hypothetical protein